MTNNNEQRITTIDDALEYLNAKSFTIFQVTHKWEAVGNGANTDELYFRDDAELIAWVEQQRTKANAVIKLKRRVP